MAGCMIPDRREFVALWKYLSGQGGILEDTAERLAESISRTKRVKTSSVRTIICLDVLQECGLLQIEYKGEVIRVQNCASDGIKMDLEKTVLMRHLREMAGQ